MALSPDLRKIFLTEASSNVPSEGIIKYFGYILFIGALFFSFLLYCHPPTSIDFFLACLIAFFVSLPFYFLIKLSFLRTEIKLNNYQIRDLNEILNKLRAGTYENSNQVAIAWYSHGERMIERTINEFIEKTAKNMTKKLQVDNEKIRTEMHNFIVDKLKNKNN